jgi:hypothetical protein
MTLYDQLEVAHDADVETIRQAIARLTAVWSRRVGTSSSLEARHEAEAMMKVLGEARQTLLDSQRRTAYDASMAGEPSLPGHGATRHEGMTDQKDCPYCGEVIKAKAMKCRHCGEFLDGAAVGATNASRDVRDPNAASTAGRWPVALLALVGIGSLLVGVILAKQGGSSTPAPASEAAVTETFATTSQVLPSPEAIADTAAAGSMEIVAETTESSVSIQTPEAPDTVEAAVEQWRSAWERMDADAMARMATSEFRGGDARRGAAFFENKRREFGITDYHTVGFNGVAVSMSGPDEAEATFSLRYASTYTAGAQQKYKQTGYANTVPTKLRFRREAEGWCIVSERFHVR